MSEKDFSPIGIKNDSSSEIDVIIPVWGKYLANLERAIQSCRPHARVIVVCDPQDKRRAYANGADVVLTRPPGGVGPARNVGLAASKAKYVLFLDADDELLPTALPSLYETLNSDTYAVAAGGRYQYRDGTGSWPLPNSRAWQAANLPIIGIAILLCRNVLPATNTCLMRRSRIPSGDLFPDLRNQDWHAVLRLRSAGRYIWVNEPMLTYTVDPDSLSRTSAVGDQHKASRAALVEAVIAIRGKRKFWLLVDKVVSLLRDK